MWTFSDVFALMIITSLLFSGANREQIDGEDFCPFLSVRSSFTPYSLVHHRDAERSLPHRPAELPTLSLASSERDQRLAPTVGV